MFRDALRSMLEANGVAVVGEASTADDAVSAVATSRPDLVVMDLHLATGSGVDATASILESSPDVRILVLTSSDEPASVDAALRVGAHGYLHKSAAPTEIARAVASVAAGDGVFDATVLRRITERFAVKSGRETDPPFPTLTPREREVLELIAQGKANPLIADALFVSLKTVRNQVSAIFTKLGVQNRAAAIVMAREQGMGSRPS